MYERFQSHFGYPTRAVAKEEFFHTLYGSLKQSKRFAEVYPAAAKVLRRLKREHGYNTASI